MLHVANQQPLAQICKHDGAHENLIEMTTGSYGAEFFIPLLLWTYVKYRLKYSAYRMPKMKLRRKRDALTRIQLRQ